MENLVALIGTSYGRNVKVKSNTLEYKVRYVLAKDPDTRNSDITLTTHIWWYFHKDSVVKINDKYYVCVSDLHELPREDNIKRIRAKIQNEEKLYLPTSETVARKRKWNEQEWRKSLGYSSVNIEEEQEVEAHLQQLGLLEKK